MKLIEITEDIYDVSIELAYAKKIMSQVKKYINTIDVLLIKMPYQNYYLQFV